MDSSQLRPFDLYLFESTSQKVLKWHFITVNKENGSFINIHDFNPDSIDLRLIYSHSSKLDHDGIAIEFIEDSSTKDSLIIYIHHIEGFETGKIEFISKSNSFSEIFKVLPSTQSHTGNYYCVENNVKIKLNLKDGITPPNYSYELNIHTPEGCSHSYLHVDYEMNNNTIEIDSLGSFTLIIKDNTVALTNTNFDSACEGIFELNYTLKKIGENK